MMLSWKSYSNFSSLLSIIKMLVPILFHFSLHYHFSLQGSGNFLGENIPPKQFHLQNLKALDLSNNDFVGSNQEVVNPQSGFDISSNSLRVVLIQHVAKPHPKILLVDPGRCSSLQLLFLNGNHLWRKFPDSLLQLQYNCKRIKVNYIFN